MSIEKKLKADGVSGEVLHRHIHESIEENNPEHSHFHEDESGRGRGPQTVAEGGHYHADGSFHSHVHESGHGHGHAHSHTHTHQNTKAVLNRLSRAIGHLESIKRMVESGRDCSEVLIQLSAVKAAINNTGKVILNDHISHCMVDAVQSGDMEAIEELKMAIDQFMK